MSAFINVLAVAILFLAGLEAVKTSDVIGSLGAGRMFEGSTVYSMGMYETAGDGGECCRECNEKHPDNQMITFFKYTSAPGEITTKYCRCSQPDLGAPQQPTTVPNRYFSEVCRPYSYDVEGGVGDGKRFVRDTDGFGLVMDTVTRLGRVSHHDLGHFVEDYGVCCQLCTQYFPGAKMVEYDTHEGKCNCYDVIPGRNPATDASELFSAVCD